MAASTAVAGREIGNQILDHLPASEQERVLAESRRVTVRARQDLFHLNAPAAAVYYPLTAVVSLVLPTSEGRHPEVGLVDHEGLVGGPAVLGVESYLSQATVQIGGECLRIPAERLRPLFRDCPSLAEFTLRFLAFAERSACQNTACNLLHVVEQRMCRSLLMVHDRVRADEFALTQEFLAHRLGASRQTVTTTAGALQSSGLITYRRGRVRIEDRAGLERNSCECYGTMRDVYQQVMGFPLTRPARSETPD